MTTSCEIDYSNIISSVSRGNSISIGGRVSSSGCSSCSSNSSGGAVRNSTSSSVVILIVVD